jgi:hypothetical protein
VATTIQSGRGTWPDDAAATCFGKVRTPRDGGTMGTVPLPKACGLYLPGHEVHWIQAFHSSDEGEAPPVPCTVVDVDDDGTVLVEVEGTRTELWTHDPLRLRAIVAQDGREGTYQERWRLLRLPHTPGEGEPHVQWCIDVTPAANPDRRPCTLGETEPTTLVERLRQTGGFTVSAAELLRWAQRDAGRDAGTACEATDIGDH